MSPLNFDMDALRSMVVGVEVGNFSHAALRLNRSASAISMQLKKLETQVGQKLFKRNGRGLALTEAGNIVLQYARRVLAVNDEMGVALGAIAKGGVVRVGIPQDFADASLQTLFTRFTKAHPATHLEVRVGKIFAFADDVANGRLDLAVGFARSGTGEERRIASLPLVWVGRTPYFDQAGDNEPAPLICFDGPCLFRDVMIETLAQAGVSWRLSLTSPSLAAVWCGLRAGLGITIRTPLGIPAGLGIATGKRVPNLPNVDVVLHDGKNPSAAAEDFKRILVEVLRDTCQIEGKVARKRR
jgi:DNA-binding transcriptional LysR family regulator